MSDPLPFWKHLQPFGLSAPAPTALYFADPMCSWCWGFSPVVAELMARYGHLMAFQCVMGGLRAGNTVPTDKAFREEILHHWHAVQQRTGQPFRYEGALPDGFVYDTEPACRAVVTVAHCASTATMGFLRSLQRAFYAEGRDVTRGDVLAGIVQENGIDPKRFLEIFRSRELRDKTAAQFQLTRDFGVAGFPTVILIDRDAAALLTTGYTSIEMLAPSVESWFARLKSTRSQTSEGG